MKARARLPRPETGVLFFIGMFAFAALWGSNAAPAHDAFPEAPGQEIVQRERCVFCHSLPGYQPTPQTVTQGLAYLQQVGTSWSRNGPDLGLEPGKRTDDWHLAHLVSPKAVLPDCPMPSYAGLPDGKLRALIAFLQTPRGPTPVPSPSLQTERERKPAPRTRASYLAGREIYRVYCAGCHGMEGNGTGAVGHLLQPAPRDFTDTTWMRKQSGAYLLDVIGRGKPGTAMPGYDGLLTADEQALVLYYLTLYANPSARQSLEEGFAVEEGQR